MSLDPRVQGQREDMIEDIHYHICQVRELLKWLKKN